MPPPLTDRQAQVLRHIAEHIVQWQRPPTRKDICRHFGWSAVNAAEQMVQVLAGKGYIALDDASTGGQGARYVRLLRWPDGVLPLIQLAG